MRLPTNGVKSVALSRMQVMHYLVADYRVKCLISAYKHTFLSNFSTIKKITMKTCCKVTN
jgi:hypothetical protein